MLGTRRRAGRLDELHVGDQVAAEQHPPELLTVDRRARDVWCRYRTNAPDVPPNQSHTRPPRPVAPRSAWRHRPSLAGRAVTFVRPRDRQQRRVLPQTHGRLTRRARSRSHAQRDPRVDDIAERVGHGTDSANRMSRPMYRSMYRPRNDPLTSIFTAVGT